MGAESTRYYNATETTVEWAVTPVPGWDFDASVDWRDWDVGLVFDLAGDWIGVRLWLGPLWLCAGYQRSRPTEEPKP